MSGLARRMQLGAAGATTASGGGGGGGGGTFVLGTTQPVDGNTGAGVVRPAPTSGNTTTNALTTASTANATYQSQHFTHDVSITANNVTFNDCYFDGQVTFHADSGIMSNCIVRGGSGKTGNQWLVKASAGTNTYLEFCDLNPSSPYDGWNGVGERNYSVYRCKIWNTVDGFSIYAATSAGGNINATIQGCYIPRLAQFRPDTQNGNRPETHNDGCEHQGGNGGTFIGNNFTAICSTDAGTQPPISPQINMSCIILTPTGGSAHNNGNITNVIIEDNWFDYGIISINCGSMSAGDSVTLKRNKFGSHMTQPGTPRPVELDANATNTIGTGADKNYYTATGNEIAYFYG